MTSVPSMFDRIGEQDPDREYFATGGTGRSHDFYTGEEQFRREMKEIYGRRWLPVDHVSRLSDKGSYTTLDIGTGSILLLHGDEGVRAYHNYCRHRGYKLVEEPSGRRQSIVCLYHCWVYDRNGALKSLNGTYLDHFFDKGENGLIPIRTEVRFGMVFVSFSDDAPDLDDALAEFGEFARAYELADLQVVQAKDYPVASNWKLVAHNVNESLHFPTAHKDLHRVTDFDDAGTYMLGGDLVGAWQVIRDGYNSVSSTGRSDRRPIPSVPEGDLQKINWITILPNLLFGFTADYVMAQWVWPESPGTCTVRHFWLFHPSETARPDFSHEAVFALWDKANHEDWELCERTHRGLSNPLWSPGQLSLDEEVVSQIDAWVARATDPAAGGTGTAT
ncbi:MULTISPECIES: aromatic ring-hydroxylating oxygenase subunit alpha [Pseudonocardia]|uniref:aromatic ring-hydroxylating oxygenase subunit alpha n=1 Tax=Pseudonocardia TaxID=1847 RepID=UPI001AD63845|nr:MULTISPECIES: aromatic ring-hydroxylating dioxygenase subunit alpha [Pseudonocardia]MBO4236225.1 Rieske 2Fe-2S domain-containing protein [Pseudonocardia alni]